MATEQFAFVWYWPAVQHHDEQRHHGDGRKRPARGSDRESSCWGFACIQHSRSDLDKRVCFRCPCSRDLRDTSSEFSLRSGVRLRGLLSDQEHEDYREGKRPAPDGVFQPIQQEELGAAEHWLHRYTKRIFGRPG